MTIVLHRAKRDVKRTCPYSRSNPDLLSPRRQDRQGTLASFSSILCDLCAFARFIPFVFEQRYAHGREGEAPAEPWLKSTPFDLFHHEGREEHEKSRMWTPAVPARIPDALQAHILSPDATARQNPFFVSFVLQSIKTVFFAHSFHAAHSTGCVRAQN